MVISVILVFEITHKEKAVLVKKICQVHFSDFTGCFNEVDLVRSWVVAAIAPTTPAPWPSTLGFLRPECFEQIGVKVGIFPNARKIQLQLPERNQPVEDVVILQVADLPSDNAFSRFLVIVLLGNPAFIA